MRNVNRIFVIALTLAMALTGADLFAQGPPGGGGKTKSFEEAVKDTEKIEGLFTTYKQKDGEYLLELRPDQLDKDYMWSLTVDKGVGEAMFSMLATMDLGESPIYFTRIGQNIQMRIRNTRFTSFNDPEMKRAIERSFSDSLAGASKIVSDPHPDTGAILVEMGPYFIRDVAAVGANFMRFRQAMYRVDTKNSFFSEVKGFPKNLEIGTTIHFDGQKPDPTLITVPDPRSLFVTYRHSIAELPAAPGFIPRLADDRVGHFITMFRDYSDDTQPSNYVYYVTRWNLQKEEPYAEMSEPVQPITYWLENSIPVQYREAVAKGALVWNAAFERIGFKNAVVVKQQPDDADWDPADSRYASIRWFAGQNAGFAIGPSRINPWTGQIFDADIGVSESWTRNRRAEYRELSDPVGAMEEMVTEMNMVPGSGTDPRFFCNYASGLVQEVGFGHEMLSIRGMDPGSDEEEQYIEDLLISLIAHEVGHTLGLRHNFRSSTIHEFDDLQDLALTEKDGLAGSVMDYTPVNIAPEGQQQGQYFQTTLGTYDYWAIEYAYSVFPGVKKPADEIAQLEEIASQVADQYMAYGTDEDIFDPRTNRYDIGADPLEYHGNRIILARELWSKIPTELVEPGDGYQAIRRAFNRGLFAAYIPTVINVPKYIGGVYTNRDHVNDPDGRLPMTPVSSARQRETLQFLNDNLFAADAFNLPPDLLNKLAATRWRDFEFSVFRMPRLEYPIHNSVWFLQGVVLNQLYNPVKLDSLVDLQYQYTNGDTPFTVAELFDGIQSTVWSEVYGTGSPRINSFRRGLQRRQLDAVIQLVTAPLPGTPEDACTMARASLKQLQAKIRSAMKSPEMDAMTMAHLDETLARIQAALDAQIIRSLG